jgi:hypothetical protein
MVAGDIAGARERYRRAVAEAKAVRGPGAVELTTATSNLAMLTADQRARAGLFAEALAVITAAVGPDHPEALWKQLAAITDLEDAHAVVAELVALCPRAARLHPTHTTLVDVCAFELAWQATAIGAGAHAVEAARLIQPGRRKLAQQLLEVYARLAEGRATAELVDELTRLADEEAGMIERLGWSQGIYAANAELALAAAARARGAAARAERAAARAIEHLELARATTGVTRGLVHRRLAWARELQGGRISGQ